jgi:ribosome-binding protein aMBF1 (putative translation factor)
MLDTWDTCWTLACGEAPNGALSPQCRPTCGDLLSIVLGRRLRWLRVERGWSRKQLAERLRVPVENVEGHERGTRPMEPRELVAYARVFRVGISEFFKDPPTEGTA